jgi:predicted ferric reductase
MGSIESALRGWRGLAEDLGEWAFYAVAVLLVLALVKRFPYRLFAKTHHWMAAIYLVLAFHTWCCSSSTGRSPWAGLWLCCWRAARYRRCGCCWAGSARSAPRTVSSNRCRPTLR